MNIDVATVFQIAGVGLLVAMISSILQESGKEDFARWVTLVGFVVVFALVIGKVDTLYREVTQVFLSAR